MSYVDDDTSIENSRPREIYTFTVGGVAWRFTSHDSVVTFGGFDYQPMAGLERSMSVVRDVDDEGDFQVSIDRGSDLACVLNGAGALPEYEASVLVQRIQLVSGEAVQVLAGSVAGTSSSGNTTSVACVSLFGDRKAVQIPAIQATKQCSYQLYGALCGVDRNDEKHDTTITSIGSNTEIEVASLHFSHTAEEYVGGEVWIGNAKRTIMSVTGHTPATLRLLAPLLVDFVGLPAGSGVQVGDAATVYLGCSRELEVCDSRFGNALNFGGLPYIGDAPRPFRALVTGTTNPPPAINGNGAI